MLHHAAYDHQLPDVLLAQAGGRSAMFFSYQIIRHTTCSPRSKNTPSAFNGPRATRRIPLAMTRSRSPNARESVLALAITACTDATQYLPASSITFLMMSRLT